MATNEQLTICFFTERLYFSTRKPCSLHFINDGRGRHTTVECHLSKMSLRQKCIELILMDRLDI